MHGTITDILPQERTRGKRFNVFVDHRYGFSLQADVAAALRVGQSVTDADVEGLLASDEQQRALDAALLFLSYRPRSEHEITRRLLQKFPPSVVDAVILKLRGLGLVNDEQFAQFWVEQRQAFRPRGSRLLKQELRHKGIQTELATQVAESVPDEREAALRAAARKARSLANLDERDFRQRMGAFLARRGFDWETINSVVRELRERGA